MKWHSVIRVAVLVSLAISFLSARPALAINITWDGTGTSWNATTPWSLLNNATTPDPGAKPGASDIANFNITTVNTAQTVNLDAAQAALGLNFVSTGTVLIQSAAGGGSANSLTLGTSGITHGATAGADTISAPIILAAPQVWTNTSAGIFTASGTVNLGANLLTIDGSATTTMSGAISGNGGLSKFGTAALRLNANNSFTGGLTINNGPVIIGNAGALNSTTPNAVTFGASSIGALTLNGFNVTLSGLNTNATVGTPFVENLNASAATLTVNNSVSNTFAGVLQDGAGGGALSLVKGGNGTLTLSGNNTFTGGLTINSGGITLGNAGALNSGTPNTLTFAPSSTGTLSLNGNSVTVRNLSTNPTFVGTPVIQNGNASPATLTVNVTGTSLIEFGGVLQDGPVAGALSFTKSGTSNTLLLEGSNQHSGLTRVTSGVLAVGHDNALGNGAAGTLVDSGAALELFGHSISGENLQLNGQLYNSGPPPASWFGDVAVTSTAAMIGNITLSGAVTGTSFQKNSFGTVTLSGVTDNVGLGVSVTGGGLELAKTSVASIDLDGVHAIGGGGLTISGGTAKLLGTGGDQIYDGANVTITGGYLDLNDRAETVFNLSMQGTGISSSGAITNSGTGDATLAVASLGQVTLSNATTISVPQSSASLKVKGKITGNFPLEMLGNGTLILEGESDFAGGVVLNAGTLAIGGNTALGTGQLLVSGGSIRGDSTPHTVSNAVVLNTGLVVTGSADLGLAGVISGPFNVTKNGTGTLTLSGSNTFTGNVTVNSGTLAIGNNTALNTATLTFTGGGIRSDFGPHNVANPIMLSATATVSGSDDLTLSGNVGGSGGLVKTGSGTLTLLGTNSFGGGTTISAGTLAQGGGTLPGVVTNSSSFVYNAGTFSGQLVNQGTATINANFAPGGGLTNTGSVAVSPGATLNLAGNGMNNQGTVSLNNSTLTATAALVNNSVITGSGTIGGSGGFSNNAQLTVAGGTLTLSNSGANANSGTTDVGAGLQLRLTGGSLANTGLINLNGGTIGGTSTLNNTTGTVVGHGTISSPFSNAGKLYVDTGLLNVSTAFNNSGEILLAGGLSTLAGTGAITNTGLVRGDGVISKTINNNAGGEIRAEPGKTIKLASAATANVGQVNLLGGMIELTGTLANNSTGFVSGNGTLKSDGLTNSGTMNFSGLANILGDVNNGPAGKIISSGGGPTTFFDDVVNNGEIRTTLGSFTVIYGAATGSGAYTGTGTVNMEGDLKPGSSPATVNFGGNLALGVAASLVIELAGTTPGTEYDQVKVAGTLALDGTLSVQLTGLTPAAGQTFDILAWGSLVGTFDTVSLPALGGGLTWNMSQLYATGVLSITSAGVPGDYNNNGIVDAADYVLWRNGGPLANEVDTPGTVNAADYTEWRARFGNSGPGSGAAIPEPQSWAIITSAILLVAAMHGLHRAATAE